MVSRSDPDDYRYMTNKHVHSRLEKTTMSTSLQIKSVLGHSVYELGSEKQGLR